MLAKIILAAVLAAFAWVIYICVTAIAVSLEDE